MHKSLQVRGVRAWERRQGWTPGHGKSDLNQWFPNWILHKNYLKKLQKENNADSRLHPRPKKLDFLEPGSEHLYFYYDLQVILIPGRGQTIKLGKL